jgi:hypothetical protein
MPASDTRDDQRGERVYSILFWVGVALAPIAALMLLVSSGTGGLKGALGVVIISVILIGVSIVMRRDGEGLRAELEETVFDEIDALRADVRADISQAAQATHRAFGEKLQYLLDQLEATRAELEATRVQVDAMRHGITQPPAPAQRHPAPASAHGGMPQASGRAGIAPGIVRHTETVQVTTRHTVMDPHDDGQRGTTYSSSSSNAHPRRGDEAWAPPPESRLRDDPWAEPAPRVREESWTEQRLREQLDRVREERGRERDDRGREERGRDDYDDRWRSRDRDSRESRQSKQDDDRWGDVRAGDRWASVRSDERGRELRMGERRAAVHSDSSGTELRIEDRWAAVRREAGISGGAWRFDDEGDQRLDVGRGDFPYRDHRDDRDERRAITGSDREERWSDYQHDYDREPDRDRRYR